MTSDARGEPPRDISDKSRPNDTPHTSAREAILRAWRLVRAPRRVLQKIERAQFLGAGRYEREPPTPPAKLTRVSVGVALLLILVLSVLFFSIVREHENESAPQPTETAPRAWLPENRPPITDSAGMPERSSSLRQLLSALFLSYPDPVLLERTLDELVSRGIDWNAVSAESLAILGEDIGRSAPRLRNGPGAQAVLDWDTSPSSEIASKPRSLEGAGLYQEGHPERTASGDAATRP